MYIADFYSHQLKVVIELDGSIHDLQEVIEYDKLREEDIISFGIKVIRFTNNEIISNIHTVVGKIQSIVNEILGSQKNNEKSN